MSNKASYNQIVKSASIMGGAAIFTMFMGLIRSKLAAVLIGSAGIGLISGLSAVQALFSVFVGLGIQSSAVREIAIAASKGNDKTIGRIVLALRRFSWASGLIGMLAIIIFSSQLSAITFNTDKYAFDIAILGTVVLFVNLTGGQLAILQGMRRISDMAIVNIIGSGFATLTATSCYYFFGMRGVVLSLVSAAAIQLLIAWYFARKVSVSAVELGWIESLNEVKHIVSLGLVFMWNGLLVSAVSYFTISLISQNLDMRAVGLFSAAFTLSGVSVNFVLGAMGTDYYPRLTAVSQDNTSANVLVNEQTEIGLLLALPGLLATLVMAPWLLKYFYTVEFLGAYELLQWFALGCFWRVVSWPLGFVMLALGKGKWFVITETGGNIIHLILIYIGFQYFGIKGVAIAFFWANFIYTAGVYTVCNYLTGFTWSVNCLRIGLYALLIMVVMFLVCRVLSTSYSLWIGGVVLVVVGLICLRVLAQRLGSEHQIVRFISSVPFFCRILASKRII